MSHNQTLSWYSRSPHTHSPTLHRAQGPTAAARPPQLNSCSKISSLKPPRQIFPFLPTVTAPTRCDAPVRHESTWIRAYICQHHLLAIWTEIKHQFSPFTQSNVTVFKNQLFFNFCTTMFPHVPTSNFGPNPMLRMAITNTSSNLPKSIAKHPN